MLKWNYKKHEYELFVPPAHWDCTVYSDDMDRVVSCAGCGKRVKYGETFTSFEVHNHTGFGYAVCKECYNEELKRKLQAENL